MAARGSKLGRMVEFFKTGDIEEVAYLEKRLGDIIEERLVRDTAKPERRKRRTKEQLAADKGKDAHTAMAAQA